MFSTKNKTKIYKSILEICKFRKKKISSQYGHFYMLEQTYNDFLTQYGRLDRAVDVTAELFEKGNDVITIHRSDLNVIYTAALNQWRLMNTLSECLNNEIKLNK